MAMAHGGHTVSPTELASGLYQAKASGTYQADMLSTARRHGFLTIPVRDMASLVQELAAQRPVIVFQNRGLESAPRWHFALVTGHDLAGPDVLLHEGRPYHRSDMRLFERGWKLGGHWGFVLLRPGELSPTGDERAHAEAAAHLEKLGRPRSSARAYRAILARWPESLGALVGLGNLSFAAGNPEEARRWLDRAVRAHPMSAAAWHNHALALGALGQRALARASSTKALALADPASRPLFEKNLKPWLQP